jgi:hypothetical protein
MSAGRTCSATQSRSPSDSRCRGTSSRLPSSLRNTTLPSPAVTNSAVTVVPASLTQTRGGSGAPLTAEKHKGAITTPQHNAKPARKRIRIGRMPHRVSARLIRQAPHRPYRPCRRRVASLFTDCASRGPTPTLLPSPVRSLRSLPAYLLLHPAARERKMFISSGRPPPAPAPVLQRYLRGSDERTGRNTRLPAPI